MFEMSDDPALKEFPATKIFEVHDMSSRIDDIKFSPDSLYLAAGSHDRVIDIYRYAGPDADGPSFGHNGRCKGHSATVIALDWSIPRALQEGSEADGEGDGELGSGEGEGVAGQLLLRSCSVDNELMHWNTSGKLVVVETQDVDWATWTTKVGFPVMGIWAKGMNSSEISHIYRSNNQKWVVAADHNGLVRLSNYPAVTQHAPCFAHRGHASHVERVAFLADDSRVISCGGADMATYQWSERTTSALRAMPPALHAACLSALSSFVSPCFWVSDRWRGMCVEVRGPGKPQPSEKAQKIYSLKAATLAWSGGAAKGLSAAEGRGGGLAVGSSMTSLAAMGSKAK